MFFSAKDFYNFIHDEDGPSWRKRYFEGEHGAATLSAVRKYVAAAKAGIVERRGNTSMTHNGVDSTIELYKWYRPWDVVPKLRDFIPPEGDYGVGIEVEMGFVSRQAAQTIAKAVSKWKYVALDIEGGEHPIEATFPPVLYSKLSSKSQVFRYLKLLRDNINLVHPHGPNNFVGTHVNVSKGGVPNVYIFSYRADDVSSIIFSLPTELKHKYFGRNPYGGANAMGTYFEFKLFDSTVDSKVLRRNINVAVALTDLICADTPISVETVVDALETGYNK